MASGQYITATISDIIDNYVNNNTFLPAIQREYVWDTEQICKLFDSLMCGYPIGSFLFWKIREEDKKKWVAYEFLRDVDKQDIHNKEANLDGVNKDIYLVLDGQQRITSLFTGLKGSYSYFYYRRRTEYLYINLLKPLSENVNPDELRYGFAYRENPFSYGPEPQLWYKVGDILNYDRPRDAKNSIKNQLVGLTEEQIATAEANLEDLHTTIFTAKCINYYEEKTDDYDKVVEIFVRTNTGGVKLEYSDILLSTATAKWRHTNARKEIHSFTDDLNQTGSGYRFGKDFVMKGAMYLTDGLPIQYRVSSFTRENLEKIEDNWDVIKDALSKAVKLISTFGFNEKNIVSKNAVLPIAYYLRNNSAKNYVMSSEKDVVIDKNNIQNWFIINILRNVFSGSSDATLKASQEILMVSSKTEFPYKQLMARFSLETKLGPAEIENLLSYNYSTRYSFLILSLLYPDRDWIDKSFNEDHIYPKAEFTYAKLSKRGYSEAKIKEYMDNYNTILNLQLLDASENKSKNAQPFDTWITTRDAGFKARHHIPTIPNYDFDHFMDFIKERRKLMVKALENISFE